MFIIPQDRIPGTRIADKHSASVESKFNELARLLIGRRLYLLQSIHEMWWTDRQAGDHAIARQSVIIVQTFDHCKSVLHDSILSTIEPKRRYRYRITA